MARKRSRNKSNNFQNYNSLNDVESEFEISDKRKNYQHNNKKPHVVITPRGENQKKYVDYLLDDAVTIVFGTGVAGSGKTMLATEVAIKGLLEGKYKKIVITRPAVSVDEQHGFLPGTLEEKLHPWVLPILDIFHEYYSIPEVKRMMENKTIAIEPLSHMRGRTFKNSFIICDEMQNSLPSQMKMVLTRLGENSKMAITGDLNQHDRTFDDNGLLDFTNKLKQSNIDEIKLINFTKKDIQRHKLIGDILKLYGED